MRDEAPGALIEATLTGTFRLLSSCATTAVRVLLTPRALVRRVEESDPDLAPPVTFAVSAVVSALLLLRLIDSSRCG